MGCRKRKEGVDRMRLIDADALIELFEEKKQKCDNLQHIVEMTGMQAIIDSQPTAYDTEKVVAELEEASCPGTEDAMNSFGDLPSMVVLLEKAVEIVRKGGGVE